MIQSVDMQENGRLGALRRYVELRGWDWSEGKPIAHGTQVIISDGKNRVTVNYYDKHGHVVPQGGESPLLSALKAWAGIAPTPSTPAEKKVVAPPPSDLPPLPHIGMDESGKGDWFGPLVVAAVCVDDAMAERLREKNVRDSKKIAVSALPSLVAAIHEIVPETHRRVRIVWPEEYNRLHAAQPNVNTVLTNVYAETARDLWESVRAAQPDATPSFICDQFAVSPQPLSNAFAAAGLPRPYQQHKAESVSIAVAAASVLATAGFARAMEELGQTGGLEGPLPRGASEIARLEQAVRTLAEKNGVDNLRCYAKLNFRPVQILLNELRLFGPSPNS